ANAADINKRVLYGRDAEGRIVGRRLICLSDEGALVAFRPYAHDGSHDFWDASNRYVTALAEAMGATTAPRGPIRCLVAPDWYDDGSVDVAHRFAFLDDGSAFRLRLASIAPDELGALLHHTTGEREVDAILAPMLVALPEVAERPELAMALVGLLRQPAALPGDVAVRLAESLVRAGADSLARRLFVEPIERHLEQTRRQNPWAPQPALDLLARLAPSRTLGLLRRTRHRGVRRWADEPCPHRLLAGARALVALSRPHQARPLLEQVIADPEAEFLHREARRRLVRLTRGEG
ncbi:MAG: hypothetical protein KC731_36390, partial [Myxococcales bacterium]|nr:hypothetical protein [Myxococcales bacterium]